MTNEVQGRMLLREWFAWWDAIPRIDAEERLGDYHVMLLGNSGWEIKDRADRVQSLIRKAYGELPVSPQEGEEGASPEKGEEPDQTVHQQMRAAYIMMARNFGGEVIARGSLN